MGYRSVIEKRIELQIRNIEAYFKRTPYQRELNRIIAREQEKKMIDPAKAAAGQKKYNDTVSSAKKNDHSGKKISQSVLKAALTNLLEYVKSLPDDQLREAINAGEANLDSLIATMVD